MIPGVFRRRSSWPSSIATGLIGWNALTLIVALGLGHPLAPTRLLLAASAAAIVQVAALRLLFPLLRMDRAVWIGAIWGAVSGMAAWAALLPFVDLLQTHLKASAAVAFYTGPAVGAFLSYFHRDDRRIERSAREAGRPVDYGRDAHWLDPFLYGAAAYLLVFLPRTTDVAASAAVVGSFVGVVAAGVSHFFLSRWNNAAWTVLPAALAGAAAGAASGWLFRSIEGQLLFGAIPTGAAAGALTFAATSAVGRLLARRESGDAA